MPSETHSQLSISYFYYYKIIINNSTQIANISHENSIFSFRPWGGKKKGSTLEEKQV